MVGEKRYLFVCMYGESRSRFFAEKMMQRGEMAMFSGWTDDAEPMIMPWMEEWADLIIILDKDIDRFERRLDMSKSASFFIEDKPEEFNEKFDLFLQVLWDLEVKE